MEAPDIIDEVNALLKMGVGDAYRLEHIKQSYIDNKSIWITDSNYLEKMRQRYLVKHEPEAPPEEEEPAGEEAGGIHCWKCGRQAPLHANFCMACGSSIFEVGSEGREGGSLPGEKKGGRPWKMLVLATVVPAAALAAVAGALLLGGIWEVTEDLPEAEPEAPVYDPDNPASKCAPGTVLDRETNACVLASSRCGSGTIYDSTSNSCVLA